MKGFYVTFILLTTITFNLITSLFITSPNQFTLWNLSSSLKVEWISSKNDPKQFHIKLVNSKLSSIQTSSLTNSFINSNQESLHLFPSSSSSSILKPSQDYQLHLKSNTAEPFAKSSNFEILPKSSLNPTTDQALNPKIPYTTHTFNPTNQSQSLEPKQQMVWQVLVSVSVSVGIGISLVSTVGGYTTMSYPALLSEV